MDGDSWLSQLMDWLLFGSNIYTWIYMDEKSGLISPAAYCHCQLEQPQWNQLFCGYLTIVEGWCFVLLVHKHWSGPVIGQLVNSCAKFACFYCNTLSIQASCPCVCLWDRWDRIWPSPSLYPSPSPQSTGSRQSHASIPSCTSINMSGANKKVHSLGIGSKNSA